MPPEAMVAHLTFGRVRLRVPTHRGDYAYFARAYTALTQWEGVKEVDVRPITGSIVILHDDLSLASLAECGKFHGIFALANLPARPVPPGVILVHAVQRLNERIRRFSHGEEDLASIMALLLAGLGTLQATRGNLLPAATSLFGQAIEVLAQQAGTRQPRVESEAVLAG